MNPELTRERFTLLDLIQAVQDEAHDDREAVAALVHLLAPAAGGGVPPSSRNQSLLQGL
jgi:hypothetical protein